MHPPKIARSTERVFYFQETLDPQAVLEAWKEELFNEEGKRIRSLSFRSDSSLAIKDSLVLVGDSLLELHYDYTRKQEVGVIIDSSLSLIKEDSFTKDKPTLLNRNTSRTAGL